MPHRLPSAVAGKPSQALQIFTSQIVNVSYASRGQHKGRGAGKEERTTSNNTIL